MKIYNSLLVGLFAFSLMGISSCDDVQNVQEWITKATKLRVSMEEQIPNIPYRKIQHETFKAYFSDLNQFALSLKNEKMREYFNEEIAKTNLNDVCQRVFPRRSSWEQLMGSCTKNRFFLCAEEVRAYPEMISIVRGSLNSDLQMLFDQADACRTAK